jgi:hypothetical protein
MAYQQLGFLEGSTSSQRRQMRFCVAPHPDELAQIRLACLERIVGELTPKQLVSQPKPIGVDEISFTIVGDFLDLPNEEVSLDFASINAVGLPWQSHNLA